MHGRVLGFSACPTWLFSNIWKLGGEIPVKQSLSLTIELKLSTFSMWSLSLVMVWVAGCCKLRHRMPRPVLYTLVSAAVLFSTHVFCCWGGPVWRAASYALFSHWSCTLLLAWLCCTVHAYATGEPGRLCFELVIGCHVFIEAGISKRIFICSVHCQWC